MCHPSGESSEFPITIPPLWLLILIFPGIVIARIKPFSFHHDRTYHCAFIHWFLETGEEPDVNTGMWQVESDFDAGGGPLHVVIHIDAMIHAAHLLGEPDGPLSASVTYVSTLHYQVCRSSCIQNCILAILIIFQQYSGKKFEYLVTGIYNKALKGAVS